MALMLTSPDFEKMYLLSDPLGSQAMRLGLSDGALQQQLSLIKELYFGRLKASAPLNLVVQRGKKPMDVLWATFTPFVGLSQRVVDLWQENGVTGWESYPINLFERENRPLAPYYGLTITGRAGRFAPHLSQIVTKQTPTRRYEAYLGYFFDPQEWDGSDIFLVSNACIVTEKVREIIVKNKIRNVRLERLPEVETPVYLDKYRDR